MALTAQEVFRDYTTDGVPSSNWHDPKKSEIRALLGQYEQIINAFTSNGGLVYSIKSGLDADLSKPANTMAWVLGDPVAANNGIYEKLDGPGAGSWARRGDLPYSFIVASDVGAGTPNAIQATSSLPIVSSALVLLNVYEVNTGSPVTVSFNGGSPLTIKTNSGNDVDAGGLVSGTLLLGRVSGSTFRLVSDQASAALLAQMETILDQVEIVRDEVLGAVPNVFTPTRASLKALDTNQIGYAYLSEPGREGQFVWRTGDYSAEVAADTAEGVYIKADGVAATVGAWVRVAFKQDAADAIARPYLTKVREWLHIGDFPVGGVGGDDTFGIQKAFEYSALTGKKLVVPALADGNTYRTTEPIEMVRPFRIEGEGTTPLIQRNFLTGINSRGAGSWFHFDHEGRGISFVPAGSEEPGGAYLKSIGIIRNQPMPDEDPFTPADNDFDIYARKGEVLIEDVTLLNATRGIDYEGERLEIRSLRGQPLVEGIRMDKCYDVCRVYDVHFWTYWSSSVEVAQYMIANAIGIRSGRNDHPFMHGIFTIFYQYGMELFQGTDGATNLLRAYGCSFDRGQTGLYITADGAEAEFFGLASQAEVGPPVVLDVSETFGANLTVLGDGNYIKCYSPDLRFARNSSVFVGGSGNNLIMENPRHNSWGQANPLGGFAGYQIENGNTVDIIGKITNFTPNQLFKGGAGTLKAVLGSALTTATTDSAGDITITHSMGAVPTYVEVTNQGGPGHSFAHSFTSTTFKIRVCDAAGTALTSTGVQVSWRAYLA